MHIKELQAMFPTVSITNYSGIKHTFVRGPSSMRADEFFYTVIPKVQDKLPNHEFFRIETDEGLVMRIKPRIDD